MIDHKITFISIVTLAILIAAVSGCIGSPLTPTPTNAPAVGNTVTATVEPAAPSPTPSADMGTYAITTDGKNVKITGNGAVKTSAFELPENWYIVKEKYDGSSVAGRADYFEYELMNLKNMSSAGDFRLQSGQWASFEDIHDPLTMQAGTTDTFYIQTFPPTVGAWSVEYIAPPAEPLLAPQMASGKGPDVIGPIKLTARTGKLTVKYNGQGSSFYVRYYQTDTNYNGYPGYFMANSSMDISNLDDYHKPIAPFQKTKDIDLGDPNSTIILEVDAMADASWSIMVSPA